MIDGLEGEDFGVSDFFNGDARVITAITDFSDAPPWVQGQIWTDPSEIAHIYGDSTVSQSWRMLDTAFELVCWSNTAVSIGTPLYIEGMFAITEPDGFLPIPIVVRAITKRSNPWAPAFGFSMENASASNYVRVGYVGMMHAFTDDASVTFGDGMYFEIADELLPVAHPGADFAGNPANGFKSGVWLEANAVAGTKLLPVWKSLMSNCEDRS
jgi:hypothetical protein